MSGQFEQSIHTAHPDSVLDADASMAADLRGRGRARFRVLWGPLFLAAVFAAWMVGTWRKWPDLLTDFGREIYIAWQLSEGAVLYRDIAYFNGPLSPYFNALACHLLGVSIGTLCVLNGLLILLLLAFLYTGIRYLSNRWIATLSGTLFLVVFAFGHLKMVGNYNYVCPYSHEMTHGLILSIGMLFFLVRAAVRSPRRHLLAAAAGICWGLVFLGKAELFIAATGAALAGLVWMGLCDRARVTCWWGPSLAFVGAGLGVVSAATAALAWQLSLPDSLRHIAGTWPFLIAGDVVHHDFYRTVMGTDQPLANLAAMGVAAGQVTLWIVAAVCFDRVCQGTARRWPWLACCGIAIAMAAILKSPAPPFLLQGLSLGIVSVGMTIGYSIAAIRQRGQPALQDRFAILSLWGIFASLLTTKMVLEPRIHHYGFVLAMPATLLFVTCLLDTLPRLLCRPPGRGNVFRVLVAFFIITDTMHFMKVSSVYYHAKTLSIGEGADRIRTYGETIHPAGPMVRQALSDIEAMVPPGATLAVLPEGALLNYWTRHPNPTGYIVLMPPELLMFGTAPILGAFERSPPDYLVLIHKDMTEYGCGPFGSANYGAAIVRWIQTHYRPLKTIGAPPGAPSGAPPSATDRFGIQILQRTPKQQDSGTLSNAP